MKLTIHKFFAYDAYGAHERTEFIVMYNVHPLEARSLSLLGKKIEKGHTKEI